MESKADIQRFDYSVETSYEYFIFDVLNIWFSDGSIFDYTACCLDFFLSESYIFIAWHLNRHLFWIINIEAFQIFISTFLHIGIKMTFYCYDLTHKFSDWIIAIFNKNQFTCLT